jgi:hypothetical protein
MSVYAKYERSVQDKLNAMQRELDKEYYDKLQENLLLSLGLDQEDVDFIYDRKPTKAKAKKGKSPFNIDTLVEQCQSLEAIDYSIWKDHPGLNDDNNELLVG